MRYGGAMPVAAITLEVLPAGYGDALLVTCPLRRSAWRMLVDTGPARVILKGGRARSIWFNYSTERVAKWLAHGLQERYGYTARAVIPSEVGVKLELG
jgi:hypothetical protein